MKTFLKKLNKAPMFYVFLLILICFLPMSLFSSGENHSRAIVMAVGIDEADEGYEVSLLSFIPTANQTYIEASSVISAEGDTIADAIGRAQLSMGKKVGFSHAKTTVISQSLLSSGDTTPVVDYLGRVASLSQNTIFIASSGSAKEFLAAAQSLQGQYGLELNELVGYNMEKVYLGDSTLESFYNGYYSPAQCSLMGYLSLEEGSSLDVQSSEENSSQASQGQTSSSQSQSSDQKKIFNEGKTMLIKKGQGVKLLDEEQLLGINILNSKALGQIIHVSNVYDDFFEGADLTFAIRSKIVRSSFRMEGSTPVMSIRLMLGLELLEINGEKDEIKLNSEFTDISDEISRAIEKLLKANFSSTLAILQQYNTDVLSVGEKMARAGGAVQAFYEALENKDEVLNDVIFELAVESFAD